MARLATTTASRIFVLNSSDGRDCRPALTYAHLSSQGCKVIGFSIRVQSKITCSRLCEWDFRYVQGFVARSYIMRQ